MYAADISFHVNCQRYENIISPVSVVVKGETDHTIKQQQMLQSHFAACRKFASHKGEN
jgi:hypothetical protein